MTVTRNVVAPWIPAMSFTVQVTGVVPIGKNVPDSGAHTGVSAIPPSSVAFGVSYVTVAPFDVVASTRMLFTSSNSGGVISTSRLISSSEA